MKASPLQDLCIIGPVSKDQIWHGDSLVQTAAGGVPTYAGLCAHALGAKVHVVTTWAEDDDAFFQKTFATSDISLIRHPSAETTTFDLRYADAHASHRDMSCSALGASIKSATWSDTPSRCAYFAPLMKNDIAPSLIQEAARHHSVALDAQGYVRDIQDGHVIPHIWQDMDDTLPSVRFLKVSAEEASLLTGQSDPEDAARALLAKGAQEIILTQDDCGAIIYNAHHTFDIPAYDPGEIVDTTGCGDTFFAAYLVHRLKSSHLRDAGMFAAAVAAMKIRHWGPSLATWDDVMIFQKMSAEMP